MLPIKPKVPLLLAGGLLAAIFLALAIPILAELRSGIMVERWQVNQIRLPDPGGAAISRALAGVSGHGGQPEKSSMGGKISGGAIGAFVTASSSR